MRQEKQKIAIVLCIVIILCHCNTNGQSQFLKHFSLGTISSQSTFPPSNSVSQIAIHDSILFIGTGNGLAKSTNGGRSWTSYHTNPAFANDGIFAVAIKKETIWVATGYDTEVSDGSIQTGSGYTYSTDVGINWMHTPQPLDTCIEVPSSDGRRHCKSELTMRYGINDSVRVSAVTTPVANVTYDIALSTGAVWIASWSSGLRKSTNNGLSWERKLLPLDSQDTLRPTDSLWYFKAADTSHRDTLFKFFDVVQNDNLKAFSVFAVDDDTIWCGTAGGVNKSTDGGNSWVKFNHQNQIAGILGDWVITIKEQRFQNKKRIWTTNWKRPAYTDEENGVSYTDDGGTTWINLLHGVKAYDFAFKDSVAYIATEDGLYRTPDGGKTFRRIANSVSLNNDPLTINSAISIYDSSLHQVITSSRFLTVGIINDTVYVGTDDGFASTIDNQDHPFGSSWKIYRTYESVGATSTTYAYPNPFSPNFELVRIHYGSKSSSSSERSVSIDIFDFGMNRVRTLINNARRSPTTEFDELWDGRDENGKVVANGVYFYRIKIDDNDPLFGKILVLQ